MNNLMIFKNKEFGSIRTVTINNEVWFVGKDVASALGYANPRKALADHVDEEDKGVTKCDTLGGTQEMTVINESGLYSLVLSSKLPNAKKFKRWITSEVLPSIRKTGAYMTDDTLEKALTSPDFLIKLATQLKEEKEARMQAEQTIEKQAPLVDFANKVSSTTDLVDMSQMAKLLSNKDIKIGRNKLFAILRMNGILKKNNEPYQRYVNNGCFEIKENTFVSDTGQYFLTIKTYVTGKGQIYISNLLKNLGF